MVACEVHLTTSNATCRLYGAAEQLFTYVSALLYGNPELGLEGAIKQVILMCLASLAAMSKGSGQLQCILTSPATGFGAEQPSREAVVWEWVFELQHKQVRG